MKIIITGGGTGGHLSIAKTLMSYALERGHECVFVGSNSGQDRSWFDNEHNGFSKKYFLDTSGVVNKKGLKKIFSIFKMFKAFLKAIFIIRKSDIVISVGGFSAAPASFASVALFKPLYIHEQNAAIGRLNSILKYKAKIFFSSYDEISPIKCYPVDKKYFHISRVRDTFKTIIFLGGSQGASAINNLAIELAPILKEKNIKIIHQCGKNDYDSLVESYKHLGIEVDLFKFSNELEKKISEADLCIGRSGASSLWELVSAALPSFFVPYPYAASDHQFYNAEFLVKQNLAYMCREGDELLDEAIKFLDCDIKTISKKLVDINSKDCAVKMIKLIEESLDA